MVRADFDQISRSFHADFHAQCDVESLHAISRKFHAGFMQKSTRNACGFHADSIRNISSPNRCLIPWCVSISRKFHAHFTQTSMQNAMRNPCGIYRCLIHAWFMQYADFTQILRRFQAYFHTECFVVSMGNLSMPNPCLIPYSMQIQIGQTTIWLAAPVDI